jgi:hypothetical protein
MEFRLVYEGPLLAQGAKAAHKWEIRRALHPQLERLWKEKPLVAVAPRRSPDSIVVDRDGLRFAPLVTQRLNLYAEVSVLLMRQQQHGALFTEGGDIDNRLKTLLDALRLPRGPNEGRGNGEREADPELFFCLMEDDALITKVSVETAQLLRPAPPDHVLAIVGVHVKKTMLTPANMAL